MKHTETDPDIPIVYEDKHLIVVNKPPNILSQKDHTGDPDIQSLCKEYLERKYSEKGKVYLGIVHRLDRPVSGLMMLAKTSKAAEHLSNQLRNQTIRKTYWTVVHGSPPINGILNHFLIKDRDKNIVSVADAGDARGKEAILSFQKLEDQDETSLVAVHLQTGRPHQIRVQFSTEGYPVWGDYKYGKSGQPDGRDIALRAVKLTFEHPEQEEEIELKLPPPLREPWSRFELDMKE